MNEVELVPRSYWTSRSRGGSFIDSSEIRGLVNHWPASRGSFGVEDKDDVADRLRGWRDYHRSKGWSDIGYNIAVDQAGRIWDLRGLWRVGAHCASSSFPDANHYYLGVLFIVGMGETPTDELIRAYQYLRTRVVWEESHGIQVDDVLGHREVRGASTKCPGDVIILLEDRLDNPYKERTLDEEDVAREIAWYRRNWIAYIERNFPEVAARRPYAWSYYPQINYARIRRIFSTLLSRGWKQSVAWHVWARVNDWADEKQGFLQYRTDKNVQEVLEIVRELRRDLTNQNPVEFTVAESTNKENADPDTTTDDEDDDLE